MSIARKRLRSPSPKVAADPAIVGFETAAALLSL